METTSLDAIRGEVEQVKKEGDYANIGDAFVQWYLTRRFDLVESEASEATVIAGPNDKGLDAVWFDDEQRTILAVQAKYSENGNADFVNKDATQLSASIEYLQDSTRLEAVKSTTLKERLREAQHRFSLDYTIQFYVVVFGRPTEEARKELAAISKKHGDKVQIFTHEINDIYNVLPRIKEIDDISETINISDNEIFRHTHENHKSILATVSAVELAELRDKFGDQLFHENVRYYLGQRGANKGMVQSLKTPDGRKNFWFYHNGITAVCRKFEVNKDSSTVKVEGLQIVNGCQTTVTLHETIDSYQHKTHVPRLLMRIIQTEGNEQLLRNISLYTNTQSAVNERDLRGKDRIQEELQNQLRSLGYFCEIKRGEWNTLSQEQKKPFISDDGKEKRLNNIDVAKAIMCWEGKPVAAKSKKKLHFDGEPVGGFYEFIFQVNRSAWEYLLAYKIMKYCEKRRKSFSEAYKAQEKDQFRDLSEDELNEWQAKLYILHAETILAAYISDVIKARVASKHYKDVFLALEDGKEKPMDYLFELVDQIISENVKERSRDRSFQMSRYYKSKKAWAETRASVTAQLRLLKKIAGKDPIDTFVDHLADAGVPAG